MSFITPEQIENAKQRLVDAYHPTKIYIFGSYAWGKPDEDSDLDLMVVVPSSYTFSKNHRRTYDGYMALAGVGFPKELIVLTEEEFAARSTDRIYLAFKVKNDGICIYARS